MVNKQCQYNYPNCQKIATFQQIVKLGAVKLDKKWVCGNCKEYIEKERMKCPNLNKVSGNQPK